jgi:hypothetical protein
MSGSDGFYLLLEPSFPSPGQDLNM